MNKIDRALKIIKQLLPNSYEIPNVRVYKTVYSMLRAEANQTGRTYEQIKKYYNDYLILGKHAQNNKYINTKYYRRAEQTGNATERCFDITALAGNPIEINLQNITDLTHKEMIFLLLHEIGHRYYKKKGQEFNEYLADKFAIRWIRRYLSRKKGE